MGGLAYFPPEVSLGLGILAHSAPWCIFAFGSISTFWTISSLYVLNFLKYFLIYILRQNVSKSDKKNFELYQGFTYNFLCQNDKIFIKIFKLYQVFVVKSFDTSKLYTTDALKALHSKNLFCFFFLIFWHAKILPSSRMPCYKH